MSRTAAAVQTRRVHLGLVRRRSARTRRRHTTGAIYDAIFTGPITASAVIINLLVVVAFLAPLFAPRRRGRTVLLAASLLVFLARTR